MVFTHKTLNNFARTFSKHVAQRAIGLDDASARIVELRPSEYILAGFLTPVQDKEEDFAPSIASDSNGEDSLTEEQLAEDLPQDSPYEQTAVGFEWLAPREALHDQAVMKVSVDCAIYVRCLPTFAEQSKYGVPKSKPSKPPTPAKQAASLSEQIQDIRFEYLVMAWAREKLAQPLQVEIDLGQLLRERVVQRDVEQDLRKALTIRDRLAPQHRVEIPIDVLQDEDSYQKWLARLPQRSLDRFWRPIVDVRISTVPTEPDCVRIALRLINRTPPNTVRKQEDFFDPNLYAVAIQADIPATAHKASVFRELPQSYRYDRSMPGVGINAHVDYQEKNGRIILTSSTVPKKEITRLVPHEVPGALPRFEDLVKNPLPILERILAAMREYDRDVWQRKVKELKGTEQKEAEEDRKRFLQEIEQFARGIRLLMDSRYPMVARAFRLMNETMDQLGKKKSRPYDSWRLFQIVFIVGMVPILAAREYPELGLPDDDQIDLLWFAAGGGKTEAFLGLILWQAFFDRMRGKKIGVTAFVRFPLRLLTFQQLQRLGDALGQAELIRVRENLAGQRFSLGFFVGGQVTDNRINDDMHQRYTKHVDESQKRIFQCPFCAAPTRLKYEPSLRLIEHYCTASNCPGGNQRLPIYIVDDDLYRYLPTVIVSTVDKMAGFGQNQRFTNLLGRFDMVCPVHGASFVNSNKDRCPAADQRRRWARPSHCEHEQRKIVVNYGPFHDPAPALLVQDELHLLSEELGTFDAHYETAIAETSRSLNYKPWKVIAATATIQEYEVHTWQLYLKRARQFPGPGPSAYESFYYRLAQESIGRIFLGLVGVGRKHTPAVTRALTIIYLELEDVRKLSEKNHAAASREYGTDPLNADEWKQLLFFYELPLIYTLTRKGSDMVAEAIESHVKKELRALVTEYGELIIEMFNSGIDVPDMIATMQKIQQSNPETDPSQRVRGLVTTNIIGHGVDVDRFNIMIFAGFPRLVSEYIQASARVGRLFPGISLFVATPQSERDRGVFNRFAKFHEYLDRLVDPSALARWPLPAVERTVPGILSGYLMGVAATSIGEGLATVEKVQAYYGRVGADALTTEEILSWMHKAYGTNKAPSSSRYAKKLETTVQNRYATVINKVSHAGGRPTALNTYLDAMRSLRDIDDPGYIHVEEQTDIKIIRRLIRRDE